MQDKVVVLYKNLKPPTRILEENLNCLSVLHLNGLLLNGFACGMECEMEYFFFGSVVRKSLSGRSYRYYKIDKE